MIHFQPNCTIPPEPPAFVLGPNIRSTMEIVWSCISTLLLCCWSIQHLNVPVQTQPTTTRQRLLRKLYFLGRKAKWMLLTLIAPEAILAKALTDSRSCRLNSRILRDLADEDGVPWSNTHTFLADMGGFALRFKPVSNLAQRRRLSASSVDPDAQSGPSLSSHWGSIIAAYVWEGRRNMEDAEGVQGQAQRQGLERSRLDNRQSQERPASMEASRGAPTTSERQSPNGQATSDQGTATQSYPEAGPSRDPDLSGLPPAIEQEKRQAEISGAPAQQKPDAKTPDEARTKMLADRQIQGRRLRERFETRVTKFSRRYGNLIWSLHEPHVIEVTEAFSTLYSSSINLGDTAPTLLTFEGDIWVLNAAQLIEVRKRELIDRLPNLTEDEVSDRDKGNFLVKFLAILQVSWMVIQLISRAILELPSTPLEIMTLSFAVCAFITYILLIGHPQDITTAIYLDASRPSTADDMLAIAKQTPICFWCPKDLPCVPDNAYHDTWPINLNKAASTAWLLTGAVAGASMFGGIHLVAWNFIFPSVLERNLWRISSLLTLLIPLVDIAVPFSLGGIMFRFQGGSTESQRIGRWYGVFVSFSVLVFVFARLFDRGFSLALLSSSGRLLCHVGC